MLLIKRRLNPGMPPDVTSWELDEPGPMQEPFPVAREQVLDVYEIEASGLELNMLMEFFPRLPWPRFNKKWAQDGTIRFFDETARYIAGNLPLVAYLP